MIDNGYFIILLQYKKSINESKKWERKEKKRVNMSNGTKKR